ncbi:MAG TPA: hypothetical protein IGS37_06890 [Synechococcales cyanobacterium M55_K2018_004]|nr:hypothetical protein [Synechococcales cyanobacterium M55_K2018_004]
MNTEELRQSLRTKWLTYYRDNRSWLTRLAVWVECDGERRPSSGFILATLSTLEPQLLQLLPIVVDLSNNPDRIVMALGLNFNPDQALKEWEEANSQPMRMLPEGRSPLHESAPAAPLTTPESQTCKTVARLDEACQGVRHDSTARTRDPL